MDLVQEVEVQDEDFAGCHEDCVHGGQCDCVCHEVKDEDEDDDVDPVAAARRGRREELTTACIGVGRRVVDLKAQLAEAERKWREAEQNYEDFACEDMIL